MGVRDIVACGACVLEIGSEWERKGLRGVERRGEERRGGEHTGSYRERLIVLLLAPLLLLFRW